MRIILLEGFYSGSHRQWADGLKKYSQHEITILSLPGRFWKWRMHGGAISLANQYKDLAFRPDLILATDMIDVSVFLALTRRSTADIPVIVYFHENQLTYPWSPTDQDPELKRDLHYAFINYQNALSADHVLFNSKYHQDSFHDSLPEFLKKYPDHHNLDTINQIKSRSSILPVGVDCKELDKYASEEEANEIPHILWNHRWEYDKDPQLFFETLFALKDSGVDFKLIVLGAKSGKQPPIFAQAKQKLRDQIVHWGFAPDRASYIQWLWRADVLPVTARQEFFGISVVEAIFCNTTPLLPKRLSYPEHIPLYWQKELFYDSDAEFSTQLTHLLTKKAKPELRSRIAEKYGWPVVTALFDAITERKAKNSVIPKIRYNI